MLENEERLELIVYHISRVEPSGLFHLMDAADLLSINLIPKPTEDLKDAERQNLLAFKEKNAVDLCKAVAPREKRNKGIKYFT